jgi:hypothetical protein
MFAVFVRLLGGGECELGLDFKPSLVVAVLLKGVLLEMGGLVDVRQLALLQVVKSALQVVNLLLNVALLLPLPLQHFRHELQLTRQLLDLLQAFPVRPPQCIISPIKPYHFLFFSADQLLQSPDSL